MAKAFSEHLKPKNPKNALVVDALNLGFRWKHSGAKVFADSFIDTVQSLAKSYDCGKVIITADWGSSSYRRSIYPEYKGNREELRAKQTEKEKQDFIDFIEEYNHTLLNLEAEGFPVIKFEKVEADDIAAYIVKHKDRLGIEKIWLVSSDRDWDLLINEDVSRFSYVTRKETTNDNWNSFYPFTIEDYITFKCLKGDAGDNVKGIKGIGDKRAAQIIEEYGTVFDIYEALPIDSKYKYIQALNENAELLLLNLELMDLLTYCEDAIGANNLAIIDDKVSEYMNV